MNSFSVFGRLSYSAHMLLYPAILIGWQFTVVPYQKKARKNLEKVEWELMPEAVPVDRDLFNPFTPIPFHNNEELKYILAKIDMRGYLNENHINVQDYKYKQYHNSFAQNDDNTYEFNWISLHGPAN